MHSFGGRQNCSATPYLPEVESVLKTFANPAILPPNSSRPDVGGIDNSTFNRLPCLNVPVAVSKYKPPGLTFIV